MGRRRRGHGGPLAPFGEWRGNQVYPWAAGWRNPLAVSFRLPRYRGGRMAGKKDYDATKNLPEGEPTQDLPKGTKTGLPKRRSVFAALDKIAKKPTK